MKKSVMKTFVVACGLVFSANVLANDASKKEYDELSRQGNEACENGDYYSALAFYEKAAKTRYGMGAKSTTFNIGGTEFYVGGAEWDRYRLGSMYEEGKCIGAKTQQGTPNYAKALEWYEYVAYASKADDLRRQYEAKFSIAMIYWQVDDGA